jgi:hypothetical protein
MDTMTEHDELEPTAPVEPRRPAYDPNNFSPADEEGRKYGFGMRVSRQVVSINDGLTVGHGRIALIPWNR